MRWTKFLPASLSLLLLAPSIDEEICQEPRDIDDISGFTRTRKRTKDNDKYEIMAMSIPFLLGWLGSILGCLLSYFYCWLGKDNRHRAHKHILPGRKCFLFQPGCLLLEPTEATVAQGVCCLLILEGLCIIFLRRGRLPGIKICTWTPMLVLRRCFSKCLFLSWNQMYSMASLSVWMLLRRRLSTETCRRELLVTIFAFVRRAIAMTFSCFRRWKFMLQMRVQYFG